MLLTAKVAFFTGLLFLFAEMPICAPPSPIVTIPVKIQCFILLLNVEDLCLCHADEGLRLFSPDVWANFLALGNRWMLVWNLQHDSYRPLWRGDRTWVAQPQDREAFIREGPAPRPHISSGSSVSATDLTQELPGFPVNVCSQSKVQERTFQTVLGSEPEEDSGLRGPLLSSFLLLTSRLPILSSIG